MGAALSQERLHLCANRCRARCNLPLQLLPHEQEDRYCYANNAAANDASHFCDNTVITSRYSWYSFVPLFLFEQFSRFANFYFLCVAILQTVPEVSITNGVPATFLPLSIVLGFDGIVTAREDYKRHQDDARANSSETLVMRDGRFSKVQWRYIKVGDILKIQRNQQVPADCVFLSSFSPDADTPDACYVQTAQLDGETNLKLRQAIPATVGYFKTDDDAARFRGVIRCEPPNAAFDKFIGTISLKPAVWVPPTKGAGSRSRHHASDVDAAAAGLSLPDAATGRGLDGSAADAAEAENELAAEVATGPGSGSYALESESTLLRGSVIRNVDYVYAMVVYTGRETKVRVRQTTRVTKRAQVETEINRFIIVLVCLLLAFCLTGTIGATEFLHDHSDAEYLGLRPPGPPGGKPAGRFQVTFIMGLRQLLTYFLLNAAFIPVSLYVTMRLARSFQMLFMERDGEMYHSEPELVRATNGLDGQYPFKVRTMDLNDELGQITHIFSDKTGTLTLNYMEFRKCMVRGVAYGMGTTSIGVDRLRREGRDVTQLLALLEAEKARGRPPGCLPHVNFTDGSETHRGRTLAGDQANPRDGRQGTALHDFLCHLALNHTVLTEVVRDADGAVIGSRLSASSPDEEAFLLAAETFGYKFASRTHETVTIRCKFPAAALPLARIGESAPLVSPSARGGSGAGAAAGAGSARSPGREDFGGCHLTFRILHILAYSQERKRMSVLVEFPVYDPVSDEVVSNAGGDIWLLCKGADAALLPRLAVSDTPDVRTTKRELAEWGSDGLRTLVFAGRRVPQSEFLSWSAAFVAACVDMETIRLRKAKAPNRIDSLMNDMETNLMLQGATANEDKLQPEVPETIAQLSRAGIKVWMVTGDKQETAVNIGFATRLLDDTMRQVVATVESAGDVRQAVKRIRIAAKRLRLERIRAAEQAAAAKTSIGNAFEWMQRRLEQLESTLGFAVAQDGDGAAEVAKLPAPVVPTLAAMPAGGSAESGGGGGDAATGVAAGGQGTPKFGGIGRASLAVLGGQPSPRLSSLPASPHLRPASSPSGPGKTPVLSPRAGSSAGDPAALHPLSPSAMGAALVAGGSRERGESFESEEGEEEHAGDLDKPSAAVAAAAAADADKSHSHAASASVSGSVEGAALSSIASALSGSSPAGAGGGSKGRGKGAFAAGSSSGDAAGDPSNAPLAAEGAVRLPAAGSRTTQGSRSMARGQGADYVELGSTGSASAPGSSNASVTSGVSSNGDSSGGSSVAGAAGRIGDSVSAPGSSRPSLQSAAMTDASTSAGGVTSGAAALAGSSAVGPSAASSTSASGSSGTAASATSSTALVVANGGSAAGAARVRDPSKLAAAAAAMPKLSGTSAPPAALQNVSAYSRVMARGGADDPPDAADDDDGAGGGACRRPAFDEAEIIGKLTSPLLGQQRRPYALIIDEGTLDAALGHPRARAYLLYVSVNCAAVICCRARPDQKARVVKLIRDGVPHSRTLAVGDGANDVDMIRQAHVGVGIAGAEGVQAANASDYSIGRFRFLQRLLLVHGRWNYHRMARLVLYTFYKNLVFVAAQFWFGTQTGFSGQKFYVEYGNQTFNLLYTSLPLLMFGIYDKDVWAENALRYPKLYDLGRRNMALNVRVFLSWFGNAIVESIMIFFIAKACYLYPDTPGAEASNAADRYPQGVTPYVFQLGTVVFSCVIAIVSMRAASEMHTHHWWFQFFTMGSAIIWIPCMWVFDAIDNDSMRGGAMQVFGSASFWFTLILTLTIASVRTIAWKAWKRMYQPELRHVVQEVQSITGDFTSVNTYTEAADIARRTGKTVEQVYEAANITQAAVAAVALRRATALNARAARARSRTAADAAAVAAAQANAAAVAAAAAVVSPADTHGHGLGLGHGHGHHITTPAVFDARLVERTLSANAPSSPADGGLGGGAARPGAGGGLEASEFDADDDDGPASAARRSLAFAAGSAGSAAAAGSGRPTTSTGTPSAAGVPAPVAVAPPLTATARSATTAVPTPMQPGGAPRSAPAGHGVSISLAPTSSTSAAAAYALGGSPLGTYGAGFAAADAANSASRRTRVDSAAVFADMASQGLRLPRGVAPPPAGSGGIGMGARGSPAATSAHGGSSGAGGASTSASASISMRRRLFDASAAAVSGGHLDAFPRVEAGSVDGDSLSGSTGSYVPPQLPMDGSTHLPVSLSSSAPASDPMAALARLQAARAARVRSMEADSSSLHRDGSPASLSYGLASARAARVLSADAARGGAASGAGGRVQGLAGLEDGEATARLLASDHTVLPVRPGTGAGGGMSSSPAPASGSALHHRSSSITASASAALARVGEVVAAELSGAHQAQPLTHGPSLEMLDRLSLETQRALIARSRTRQTSSGSSASAASAGGANAAAAAAAGAGSYIPDDDDGLGPAAAGSGSGPGVAAVPAHSRRMSAGSAALSLDPAASDFVARNYARFSVARASGASAAAAATAAAAGSSGLPSTSASPAAGGAAAAGMTRSARPSPAVSATAGAAAGAGAFAGTVVDDDSESDDVDAQDE